MSDEILKNLSTKRLTIIWMSFWIMKTTREIKEPQMISYQKYTLSFYNFRMFQPEWEDIRRSSHSEDLTIPNVEQKSFTKKLKNLVKSHFSKLVARCCHIRSNRNLLVTIILHHGWAVQNLLNLSDEEKRD